MQKIQDILGKILRNDERSAVFCSASGIYSNQVLLHNNLVTNGHKMFHMSRIRGRAREVAGVTSATPGT